MNLKSCISIKFIVLFSLSLIILSSCSSVSPEKVVENFKSAITDINSGDVSLNLSIAGSDNEDSVDFKANLDFLFNRKKDDSRTADVKVSMTGDMSAEGKVINGDIDFNVITIDQDYFVNLIKLESSDESIDSIKPFLESYTGQWLHIAKDFIPENIRELQQKDEITLEKEAKLKKIFVDTNIFDVVKNFGIEKLNGNKVYHYGIKFNEDGIQDYIRESAIIDGRELTDSEVKEASSIVSRITGAELWIGKKDFYLYKATMTLSGGLTDKDSDVKILISINANSYNKDIEINAPLDPQEFNPLELIMGNNSVDTPLEESLEAE